MGGVVPDLDFSNLGEFVTLVKINKLCDLAPSVALVDWAKEFVALVVLDNNNQSGWSA